MDAITVSFSLAGILLSIFGGLFTVLYKRMSKSEGRLTKHEIMFAEIASLPKRLDYHEKEEREMFREITNILNQVKIDVAVIKRITNGKS